MKVLETGLPGVLLLEPKVFGDPRGFFMEIWQAARYHEAGMPERFVQDNRSRSRRGVLRGLHYQLTQPQGKLVWVTRGAVFDVAVDIRQGSPNFGRWYGCLLDDVNHRQLYIPPGFAHGFCVVSDEADFFYKCTDYYHPSSERGIAWDDPEIAIDWPLREVSLSAKDRQNPRLSAQPPENLPVYEERPLDPSPLPLQE
ncbi:MAG: dTDP-4-dehydrorhamnose 3,5-epimerase [Candidatus Contendobacter sp.]|nr:dTDP-4-dehydrorhamnose 3,5-epimerase [Candidatus Contendobacter sp.]